MALNGAGEGLALVTHGLEGSGGDAPSASEIATAVWAYTTRELTENVTLSTTTIDDIAYATNELFFNDYESQMLSDIVGAIWNSDPDDYDDTDSGETAYRFLRMQRNLAAILGLVV